MNETNPKDGLRREGGSYAGKRKRPTKKHIKERKFVIHPPELCPTTIDLHKTRRHSATIPLDGSETEDEIRESLMGKLPQLRGISFRLFTKSKQGNHFCPCSPKCIDSSHAENNIVEWNAKNIRKMAKGHKVVYIHCQENRLERPNTECMPTAGSPLKANLLPDYALDSDLSDEDIRQLIGDINLQDRNDQQLNDCTNLGKLPLQEDVDRDEEEQDRGDDEGENGDDDADDDEESEEEDGVNEMQGESEVHASTSGPDSAYQTASAKSMSVVQGREAASATSRMDEGITSSTVSIRCITPKEGNIEGGYEFYLKAALVGSVGQLQVLFGDRPADSVELIPDRDLVIGDVPPSPISGVVQVRLVNIFGDPISINTVPFEYKTDDKLEEELQEFKMYIDKNASSPGLCLRMTSMLIEKMKELEEGTNSKGNTKTRALSHLRLIVAAAAKINAMDLFAIIFSTSVGRNVFKCFKGDDLLLEEVARGNGHEELARFLEQKHSMYREDESDSDDEVDWKSLAKAVENFERQNSEGGKRNRSMGSSEDSFAYNGDAEDSLSLISEIDRSWETFTEGPFEEQESNALGKCEVGPQTVIPEESISWSKSSLSDRANSVIGRDAECEEIIDKLASSQFRVAVIYGALGIGKTTLAVAVGDKLLSKGWIVDYHVCSDLKATMDHLTMLSRPSQIADPADPSNGLEGLHPTLLILDQVENLLENEQSVFVPEALEAVLEPSLDVRSVRVLFVSRKQIFFKDDLAFRFRLEPLSKVAAIELLRRGSKISCQDELGVISEGCGYNPLALKIILALIHEGMLEMEIASEMSTPEQFWKSLVEKILNTRDADTKVVKKDILEGHLSRLLHAKLTVQMQLFFESWVDGKSYQMKDKDRRYSEKVSDPRYCHCKLCMKTYRSTASPAGSQNQNRKKEEGNDSKLGTSKPLTARGDINIETSVASSHAASASSSYTNLSVKTRNENITASMLPQELSLREKERRKQLRFRRRLIALIMTMIVVAVSVWTIPFLPLFKADQELESKDPTFPQERADEVNADFPCKTQQIHWIGSQGRRYKCLECPDCPEGSQPSVPCGSSVAFGTDIHCVRCQLGKTYSDKYGKRQCEACTVCSKGKTIKKNCTLSSNTECDNKCAVGFYPGPLIFHCLPLTVLNASIRVPTTQPGKTDHLAISLRALSSVPSAWSTNNRKALEDREESEEKNTDNRTYVILPTVFASIAITLIFGLVVYTVHGRRTDLHYRHNVNTVEQPAQNNLAATPLLVEMNPTYSCLEQLENENQELFDWMCARLDNGGWLIRRDYERLAAKYKLISPEERNALHDELQHKGSPSRMLMSLVMTRYPNLPLSDFVKSLKEIRRNDIAQKLMPYVRYNETSHRHNVDTVEQPAQNNLAATPLLVEMNPTYSCLEQLENENQELFDWMCSTLDNGGWLFRRDYERLAAKYRLISPEERNALHDALQHKGSPSRMLMSLVQTRYPNLPLSDFVKSLKEIKRNDIAQKLMPYVRYNETSNSLAH